MSCCFLKLQLIPVGVRVPSRDRENYLYFPLYIIIIPFCIIYKKPNKLMIRNILLQTFLSFHSYLSKK